MHLLNISTIMLITTTISIVYGSTHICDDSICDFGICNTWNNCADYNFICTDTTLECSFTCKKNCHNINITSSSNYTTISCANRYSCKNIEIEITQPTSELYLYCKKTWSCSNITIYSHLKSSFHCTDNDNYQCSNDIQITLISYSPTLYPTSIPTLYPTEIPIYISSIPTMNSTYSPTLNPTFSDIYYVTKTVVVVYAQSISKTDTSNVLTIGIILFSITLICICMLTLYKNRQKRIICVNVEQENINKIPITQTNILCDGTCNGYLEGMDKTNDNEAMLSDSEYDQLYEGRHQTKSLKNYKHINDENEEIITDNNLGLHLELPKSPSKILNNINTSDNNNNLLQIVEDIIDSASYSGDEMQLLYGPGG
eukprot:73188_1